MAYIPSECTIDQYKNAIYNEDARHKCYLSFNGVEYENVDKSLEKITITSNILNSSNKMFMLDNLVAKNVEIVIRDIDTNIIQDDVELKIGTYINDTIGYVYVPIGKFLLQETPTTDNRKTTIKLRDYAVKLDYEYNAKPLIDANGGSATKMQILQDICQKYGIVCGITSFLGDSEKVGIFDESINARIYVSYLAEQAGCIPYIDRGGKLQFKNIKDLYTWSLPLQFVEKYENSEKYKISKVIYEGGIIKYENPTGEPTNDILYLDSSNPYITSQEQVNSIYDKVKNFEINSFKIPKILGNPAIDPWDLISLTDKDSVVYKTLGQNTLNYNGKLIQSFETIISREERTTNVSKNSNESFRKYAKTEIDNIKGEVNILAGSKADKTYVDTKLKTSDTINGNNLIQFENSAGKDLIYMRIDGKSEQKTRSGKNLYNYEDKILSSEGVIVDKDGWITASYDNSAGTTSKYMNYYTRPSSLLKTSTNYIVFIEIKAVSGTGYLNSVSNNSNSYASQSTSNVISDLSKLKAGDIKTGVITTVADFSNSKSMLRSFVSFSAGQSGSITFRISVLEDTSTTVNNFVYEPFGVMPSTDYPSEIKSVGYENLFDGQFENGIVNYKTGNKLSNATLIRSKNYIEVKSNTNYRFSAENYDYVSVCVYEYDKDLNFIQYLVDGQPSQHTINFSRNFTTTSQTKYILFRPPGVITNTDFKLIMTEGITSHSYIPYGKYGIEVKNIGDNLFSGFFKGKGLSSSNGLETTNNSGAVSDYIPIDFDRDTSYTLSGLTNTLASFVAGYDENYVFVGRTSGVERTTLTFYKTTFGAGTPSSNKPIKYIRVYQYFRTGNTGTIDDIDNLQVMLNPGSTSLDYEPYKENTSLLVLDQPLRSLPNGIADRLFIKNNILCVERKVGTVVLNGSENWFKSSFSMIDRFGIPSSLLNNAKSINSSSSKCTHFIYSAETKKGTYKSISPNLYFDFDKANTTTLADFKSWLAENNVFVQYELATPVIEEIGEVEMPSTFLGGNIMSIYSNLITNVSLKYYLNSEFIQTFTTTEDVNAMIKVSENSIRSEISGTYITKTETNDIVDNKINGIKVGGRNLLLKSDEKVENSNYRIGIYYLTETPIDNKEYTFSLKGQLGENKAMFSIYNSGSSVTLSNLTYDSNLDIYKKTFKWRTGGTSNKYIAVYTIPSSVSSTSKIDWVKLEEGNVATDWTPAPEDVDNTIAETKTTMTNLIEQKVEDSQNSITLEVANKYETKEDSATNISNAKTEAINSANSNTTNQLKSYAKTTDVDAKLELKVGKNDNDQVVSMLNASAEQISLTGNRISITSDNFILDNNGNATMSSATLKDGILKLGEKVMAGVSGILTNLQFSSGYVILGQPQLSHEGVSLTKSKLELTAYVPSNFTIESAYIALDVFKTKNIYVDVMGGGNQISNNGKVQNIRLYKENIATEYATGPLGTFTYSGTGSEVYNAFSGGKFTATTIEHSNAITTDIKSSLNTTGTTRLYLQTSDNLLDGNTTLGVTNATKQTQVASATLNILGYVKL